MSTMNLITRIHVTVRQPVLKLSPLLRFSLATASKRDDGKPNLLPTRIPPRCCHDLFRCRNIVAWRIGDGRNQVFFCGSHLERYWRAGHDVTDHTVERWKQ